MVGLVFPYARPRAGDQIALLIDSFQDDSDSFSRAEEKPIDRSRQSAIDDVAELQPKCGRTKWCNMHATPSAKKISDRRLAPTLQNGTFDCRQSSLADELEDLTESLNKCQSVPTDRPVQSLHCIVAVGRIVLANQVEPISNPFLQQTLATPVPL